MLQGDKISFPKATQIWVMYNSDAGIYCEELIVPEINIDASLEIQEQFEIGIIGIADSEYLSF